MQEGGTEKKTCIKATPHKDRLTALHAICLHKFRHITQILLNLRQQICVEFRRSDEISVCASCTQSLCGIALTFPVIERRPEKWYNDKDVNALKKEPGKCPAKCLRRAEAGYDITAGFKKIEILAGNTCPQK